MVVVTRTWSLTSRVVGTRASTVVVFTLCTIVIVSLPTCPLAAIFCVQNENQFIKMKPPLLEQNAIKLLEICYKLKMF